MRRVLICMLLTLAVGPAPAERISADDLPFLYTAVKVYDALAWMNGGERFPSGATVFAHSSNGESALAAGFAASADPAVSFDGRRVLFAGKRGSQDHWQIWETAIEGGDPKPVTKCAEDCIRPFYLPEDRIVYSEKVDGRFAIEATAAEGGKPFALTHWPENSIATDVLRDGRILFEASFVERHKTRPEIYTVYSDGSGVESYRCDHGSARYAARQVASGDIVFAAEGKLARFTSALAKQVAVMAPAGEYSGDVVETSSGGWLLSYRSQPDGPFGLMSWKPGKSGLQPVLRASGLNLLQPTILAEHAVPKRHPSGLHDWAVANLLCLNAYTSKYKFSAGSVHSVRVYTTGGRGIELLGTASVEADGSFFVQIAGDQPIQIELLDAHGATLKREAGWFWLRRGEQRACVGCHTGPETAPENAVPAILLKSTTPADMTQRAGVANAAGGH